MGKFAGQMLSRRKAQKESGSTKFEEFSGDSELAETELGDSRWGTGEEASECAQQIALGSCNDALSAGGGWCEDESGSWKGQTLLAKLQTH